MSSDEEAGFEDGQTKAKILDTLAKYGDSLLDDDAYRAKSKKRKKTKSDSIDLEETNSQTETIKSKRRKKKKKKGPKSENGFGDGETSDHEDIDGDCKSGELHGEQRHLEQLKQKLGLNNLDFLQSVKQKKESTTKSDSSKEKPGTKVRGKRPPPEVIVFEDPAKRNKNKDKTPLPLPRLRRTSSGDSDSEGEEEGEGRGRPAPRDPNLFDMRRAKHDVHLLGIKGMEKTDKERAKNDLLIKLGAKPAKKAAVNYKQLQLMRKKEKVDMEAHRELERALGNKISKANIRKRRQRDQNDIGPVDGQVGKYKSGVQVLNRQEIRSIKSARGRRRR